VASSSCQLLEGATGISLDLDISVIFQDIIAIFLLRGRSSLGLQIPQLNFWFGGQPSKMKIVFELIVKIYCNKKILQILLED